MIEMKVDGLKEVTTCFTRISNDKFIQEIMDWGTDNAMGRAQGLCPVDTGVLFSSITKTYLVLGGMICAGESCPDKRAWYNEFGSPTTPFGAAKYSGYRPFLRPAVIDMINDLPNELGKRIEVFVNNVRFNINV